MITFCGKDCDSCTWREVQGCPGCGEGTGRSFSGDCQIAACCREKGHESCETCNFLGNGCMKYRSRDDAPVVRQQVVERKLERQKWLHENAPMLGKWLWVLFWLVIPRLAANLMTNENVLKAAPGLQVPGEVLGLLCAAAYAWCLWQLRQQGARYRRAAICNFALAGANVLTMGLVGVETSLGKAALALLILLPMMAVSLYSTYQEYQAHAEVLDGLDDELAENWRKLWKWEVGFLLGIVGCLLLVIISAMLGLMALIVVVIGLIVVSILKLVYLYRMAKFFREYLPVRSMEVKE